MESYKSSMERKRAYYPMRMGKYAYKTLSEKIGFKEVLIELSLIGPRTKLTKFFGCSFELLKRLFDEHGIKSFHPSYWKKAENKDWDLHFDKRIEQFKKKYLGKYP